MALYYICKIHAKHWSQLWFILCHLGIINDNIYEQTKLYFFIMMWEDVLCFPVSGNYQKKKKNVAITYLWPYEEHTFLSDIYWTGTECVGHRTYIFLHLEDKARTALLYKVFVLYIPSRNVWKFLLYYISFPLNIVRLTKKD